MLHKDGPDPYEKGRLAGNALGKLNKLAHKGRKPGKYLSAVNQTRLNRSKLIEKNTAKLILADRAKSNRVNEQAATRYESFECSSPSSTRNKDLTRNPSPNSSVSFLNEKKCRITIPLSSNFNSTENEAIQTTRSKALMKRNARVFDIIDDEDDKDESSSLSLKKTPRPKRSKQSNPVDKKGSVLSSLTSFKPFAQPSSLSPIELLKRKKLTDRRRDYDSPFPMIPTSDLVPTSDIRMEPKQSFTEFSQHGISVTLNDLERLRPTEFLNDVLIDFFLKHYMSTFNGKETCHLFNCFFYTKLRENSYDKVKKWAPADLFKKKMLFIPVHESAHWFLIVVFLNDPEDRKEKFGTIVAFDSIMSRHKSHFAKIREYLCDAWNDIKKLEGDTKQELTSLNTELFSCITASVPKQQNSFDCGVFLIFFYRQVLSTGHFTDAIVCRSNDQLGNEKRKQLSQVLIDLSQEYGKRKAKT